MAIIIVITIGLIGILVISRLFSGRDDRVRVTTVSRNGRKDYNGRYIQGK